VGKRGKKNVKPPPASRTTNGKACRKETKKPPAGFYTGQPDCLILGETPLQAKSVGRCPSHGKPEMPGQKRQRKKRTICKRRRLCNERGDEGDSQRISAGEAEKGHEQEVSENPGSSRPPVPPVIEKRTGKGGGNIRTPNKRRVSSITKTWVERLKVEGESSKTTRRGTLDACRSG